MGELSTLVHRPIDALGD